MKQKTDISYILRSLIWQLLVFKLYSLTAQKMKFTITDFFSNCDQIRSFLRIWSHLLKISVMKKFIFCAVGWGLFGNQKLETLTIDPNFISSYWWHILSFMYLLIWYCNFCNTVFTTCFRWKNWQHPDMSQQTQRIEKIKVFSKETADLVIFTKEILRGKLQLLCSAV